MPRKMPNEYEVGYGKPPAHQYFQPGTSGNPKGRPKGSRNLTTIIEAALNEKVAIKENGQRRQVPKREIIIKQQVNKAAAGDPKATSIVLGWIHQVEARGIAAAAQEGGTSSNFSECENLIIAGLSKRFRQSGGEGS